MSYLRAYLMTKEEARKLHHGIYRLYWKDGGSSLASVGGLHDGTRWFAPINWTSKAPDGIASTKWVYVEYVHKVLES